jgi:hypothetical protein
MSTDARSTEVVYEAPPRTAAWWASLLGGAAFVAFVTWIAFRMFDNRAAALAVLLLGVAVPLVSGRSGPLRVRRVTVDHADKAVTVAHATGTLRVPFAAVTAVTHGEELAGEGVTLDVVTLARSDGAPIRFGVLDRAAAEGTARALRAVLSLPDPAPPATAQPSDDASA